MLEDGKKGNNTNKNEVFCNPSQSSITLVNGKGPTNNEKKKGKSFYKNHLIIFNQSCSIVGGMERA
jgi:hypothetical protein